MEVIGQDTLKECAKKYQNARSALSRWLRLSEAADWKTFLDVKATFETIDYILPNQYCFDIAGNHCRLLTAISFQLSTVTIIDFMTHAEYDKKDLNAR